MNIAFLLNLLKGSMPEQGDFRFVYSKGIDQENRSTWEIMLLRIDEDGSQHVIVEFTMRLPK